jgi:hypothetical protein
VVNVVVIQGAVISGAGSAFFLQIDGEVFSSSVSAGSVSVKASGEVAEYVATVIQSGLLCVVKGRYVPAGNYIEAEAVSMFRDKLEEGDPMWDFRVPPGSN